MTYPQTLRYLYEQLPMFHRVGAAAYKADLNNINALCKLLHQPEKKFRSIHIAGTNGKGSTSHMLAAILQTAGYKTGLFTSPHLKDFRERIRINGKMIPKKEVTSFVENHEGAFENIQPSFFEWTVALCFNYFAKEKVDIAVIETGLGGRLDSTNVITPVLSIITNIGWDHSNLLGNSLEKIAVEKAGIIKNSVPVVIGEKKKNIIAILTENAKKKKSKFFLSNKTEIAKEIRKKDPVSFILSVKTANKQWPLISLDLKGHYQKKNITTVLCSIEELKRQGWTISDSSVVKALQNVRSLTGLHGRWEIIKDSPLTICDVAHNKDGIGEVVKQLKRTPHKKLHFVFGVVQDKDIAPMLKLLPKTAIYYFCKADIPRALDAGELNQIASKYKLKGKSFPSVKSALKAAQRSAKKNDLVFVSGSIFVVAEVI